MKPRRTIIKALAIVASEGTNGMWSADPREWDSDELERAGCTVAEHLEFLRCASAKDLRAWAAEAGRD